jgi:hypothetical protein
MSNLRGVASIRAMLMVRKEKTEGGEPRRASFVSLLHSVASYVKGNY